MKRLAFIALIALAACATGGAATRAPTAADIQGAMLAELQMRTVGDAVVNQVTVRDLSCRPEADGCFQCSYTADIARSAREGTANVRVDSSEQRADMVCNVTGSWTLTPMSQIGS